MLQTGGTYVGRVCTLERTDSSPFHFILWIVFAVRRSLRWQTTNNQLPLPPLVSTNDLKTRVHTLCSQFGFIVVDGFSAFGTFVRWLCFPRHPGTVLVSCCCSRLLWMRRRMQRVTEAPSRCNKVKIRSSGRTVIVSRCLLAYRGLLIHHRKFSLSLRIKELSF